MVDESTESRTPELPEWELAFRFMSGRLCLAFCATVGERWRRNFERLRSPGDLARWTVEAAMLPEKPAPSASALSDARVLREAIYRAVRAGMAGKPIPRRDREKINAWARRPDLAIQLAKDGTKLVSGGDDPLGACLASLARDAVDLLSGPQLARVRECAAPDCALLFLDRSRPGRRRWCADGACGSKSRSARYRSRQGTG